MDDALQVSLVLEATFLRLQTLLAEVTGLPRKHITELCQGRRAVTADTALILARVFGNTAEFWLNTQRRTDVWEALHTPKRLDRIERAQPLPREPYKPSPSPEPHFPALKGRTARSSVMRKCSLRQSCTMPLPWKFQRLPVISLRSR